MTAQLRVAGALSAAIATLIVLGLPLSILLLLDSASSAACGGPATGPGPASVPGIPTGLLPIFEGAAQQFGLGNDGWAYLAALNNAESSFGTDNGAGTGVLSGSNRELAGGAGRLERLPARDRPDQPARRPIHHHPTGRDPVVATVSAPVPAGGEGCMPVSGPTTPGAVARVLPNGLAAIPQGAPAAVQEMIAAGNQIIHYPYSYAGGHSPASMRAPPGPDADPGAQENGGPGYDCSSAVSFLLWAAGLGQSLLAGQVPTSWTLETDGLPGAWQWATIYAGTSAGQGHTFIKVAGIALDTVHGTPTSPAGTGPRWQPASEIAYETATSSFITRHPPGL